MHFYQVFRLEFPYTRQVNVWYKWKPILSLVSLMVITLSFHDFIVIIIEFIRFFGLHFVRFIVNAFYAYFQCSQVVKLALKTIFRHLPVHEHSLPLVAAAGCYLRMEREELLLSVVYLHHQSHLRCPSHLQLFH